MLLYTGDEMGFMIAWDLSALIKKLEMAYPSSQQKDNLYGNSQTLKGTSKTSKQAPEDASEFEMEECDLD